MDSLIFSTMITWGAMKKVIRYVQLAWRNRRRKGEGEEKKMKIEIIRFRHEWAFSICLTPGAFWIEVLYFSFILRTDKFAKENDPK